MKRYIRNVLLQLNTDFYQKTGESFSNKRQYSWNGWKKVLSIIHTTFSDKDCISVLDVGCGNGRFYGFLKNSGTQYNSTYTGYDYSTVLLDEAKKKYPKVEFIYEDVITNTGKLKSGFDVVVAFGITHHIPGMGFRLDWFKKISKKVNANGLLICTFWQFENKKRFIKHRQIISGKHIIKEADLEPGDYFLPWDKQKGVYRYAHSYSKKEIDQLKLELKKTNMQRKEVFTADGKTNDLNMYILWQKI